MVRYFMIFLLLISFQANAVAGALMMSNMTALSMATEKHALLMHQEPNMHSMEHHEKAANHCSDTQHAGECESPTGDCDKHSDCGLCSGHHFKAVLAHNFDIPLTCQFDFESNYTFSGVPVTHPLHLKPPKFI